MISNTQKTVQNCSLVNETPAMNKKLEFLIETTKKYGLSTKDFVVVGSYVLESKGIRKSNDINILLELDKRKIISKKKSISMLSEDVDVRKGNYGKNLNITDSDLINNPRFHVLIQNIKIVRLEIHFAKIILTKRKHNIRDIKLVEKYIVSNPSEFDWDFFKEILLNAQSREQPMSFASKYAFLFIEGLRNPRTAVKYVYNRYQLYIARFFSLDKPTNALKSQLKTKIPTNALLANHFIDNRLVRWDFILRYQMIGYILNNCEKSLRPYKKMQELTAKRDIASFKELVHSMKTEGFLDKYPIPITKKGLITDGSHRLVCALYFDIKEIPVEIVSVYKKNGKYPKQWFVDNQFNSEVIELISETRKKLFLDKGIYFPVIIWSPAKRFFQKISEDIRSKNVCVFESKIEINNYYNFLNEVYETYDISKWKIEVESCFMKGNEPVIYFMLLEVSQPCFRSKDGYNSYLSETMADLKSQVRNKYRKKIKDYYYGIILHIGDNYDHNEAIIKIVQKHRKIQAAEIKNTPGN